VPALVVPLFGVVCCTGVVGVSLEVGGVDVGVAEVGGGVELLGVAEVGVGVGVGVVGVGDVGMVVAAVQLKSVRKVN
jgi:hypothetical protein